VAITGNLLPANAESVETDASAWQALINSTNPTQAIRRDARKSKCLLVQVGRRQVTSRWA
jgi:hypothetical protein